MSETSVQERFHAGSGSGSPKSNGLRVVDWRSEILQAMFWLRNEGFGDSVDSVLLERFLGVGAHVDRQDLDRLVDEGYVEPVGRRYALSGAGNRKARLDFAAAFEAFMRPAPPECSRAAWCNVIDSLELQMET